MWERVRRDRDAAEFLDLLDEVTREPVRGGVVVVEPAVQGGMARIVDAWSKAATSPHRHL